MQQRLWYATEDQRLSSWRWLNYSDTGMFDWETGRFEAKAHSASLAKIKRVERVRARFPWGSTLILLLAGAAIMYAMFAGVAAFTARGPNPFPTWGAPAAAIFFVLVVGAMAISTQFVMHWVQVTATNPAGNDVVHNFMEPYMNAWEGGKRLAAAFEEVMRR